MEEGAPPRLMEDRAPSDTWFQIKWGLKLRAPNPHTGKLWVSEGGLGASR